MSEPRYLSPADVRNQLDALDLPVGPRASLEQILALDWEMPRPRILVASIHAALFAGKSTETANRSLSRIVNETNERARETNVGLKAQRTQTKRGGAAARYLWFERWDWAPSGVQRTRADMPETSAMPTGSRIPDQRGLPAGAEDEAERQSAPPPQPRRQQLTDLAKMARERRPRVADQLGACADLGKVDDWLEPAAPAPGPEPVVALDYLIQWLDDPEAPALFALLGEYGMGKTITCQALKERLDRRDPDADGPFALYFDLRLITGLERRTPTLREVCEECMERGWQGEAAAGAYRLDDVLCWAGAGALVIFDGLDEVLVKLTAADGQTFTRSLLGLPGLVNAAHADSPPRPRLLISCRTHFFRSLRDQQNYFTCQERSGPRPDAFRALILLPFTDAQVRRYLSAALAEEAPGVERLLETIRSVHNLNELSQRPYTLSLLTDQLPGIERLRLAGRPVHGATLYRGMVDRWLERDSDSGKHHVQPEHKRRLAAHLAAHLWRDGSGLLPANRIEPWLHAWLDAEPDLRLRYQRLHPDQLEEDLRTATFLVRDDNAGGSFRFAHTSLLEYFLAEYLLDAIRADAPERWVMPAPSPETLDFLGQLLAEAAGLIQTLARWRTPYRSRTSELLLDYALRALERGWPAPSLRGIALTGADLSDRVFRAQPGRPALDLSEADFSGAVLRRVIFDGVCLRGARFREAVLTQASVLNGDAVGSDWSGSRCDGTVWRRVDLAGARWAGVRGLGAELIQAGGDGAELHEIGFRCSPASGLVADGERPTLRLFAGHVGEICACAFCSDGERLLTGGADGTLRLWDGASGVELLVLEGHQGGVSACACSPDGLRLLSGGSDGTLRLWDAASGVVLLCCNGHDDEVLACAFSQDGTRMLSGGLDGTLRMWDSSSGAALLRCTGHRSKISSCAFGPDGTQLLSGGYDGTLQLWDATSGELLRRYRDPGSFRLHACAYSSDGTRLLSANGDCWGQGSLRLWDVVSGAVLLRCDSDQGGFLACAFSPDGRRLLSGGYDGTLRLWDTLTGAELLRCETHGLWVPACGFSPDGRRLMAGSFDGTLGIWDAHTGSALLHCQAAHGELLTSIVSLHGEPHLLSIQRDSTLRVWDARGGAALLSCAINMRQVVACAISPDGTTALAGGRNGMLRLVDVASGVEILTWEGHRGGVSTCAFSPDGKQLLSGGIYDHLRLWDAASGTELLSCNGQRHWFTSCAFSPDGARLLAVGHDGVVRLWDGTSGALIVRCEGHRSLVEACAFSPDEERLLSGGNDGTLRVWDTQDGAELLRCKSHRGRVLDCAFNADGTRLLSGGDDGRLRLWDAANGAELLCCHGHVGAINNCAFSPDGTQLLSGGADGTLRLWDAATGELLRVLAIQTAPWPGHAVWEPPSNRVIAWSGNAWRWLRWAATDNHGQPDPLPLETYPDILAPDDD